MTTVGETIQQGLEISIKKGRAFNQFLGKYNEDCEHVEFVYKIYGEPEVITEGGMTITHLPMPRRERVESLSISNSYSADWEDVVNNHKYVLSSVANKWNLNEYKNMSNSLHEKSINKVVSLEEFNEGNDAIVLLDGYKRYADVMLTSFINEHLKKMKEYRPWYLYGPKIKEEKGSAFIGYLQHLDVYGIPMMDKNRFLVYEKNKIELNISPLNTFLESELLLTLSERLNVWQIEPNSCISYTIE